MEPGEILLIEKMNAWINTTRIKYPWIISGVIWFAWLIALLAGKENLDLTGNLKGTDFSAFYTAGKIILLGRSPDLYNLDLVNAIQQELFGYPASGFNPYLNPPHFAAIMAPFSALPYLLALFIWTILGLIAFWFSLKWLGIEKAKKTALWALTWFPVFTVVSFGQNSFFTLAIFCLTYYLWIRDRHWFAGVVFSLLLLKPQFISGIAFLWILDWRKSWKSLIGLAIGILVQIGTSFLLLPEANLSFFRYAWKVLPNLIHLEGFPIWNAFSVQSFWLSIFPRHPALAEFLFWICFVIGIFFFYKFWKKFQHEKIIVFSASIILLVWCVPYIMLYDWTLLLIPAILFWNYLPRFQTTWKALFAIMWIAGLLSSNLSYLQAKIMPIVIQIGIPVFAGVSIVIYRMLMRGKTLSTTENS